jgi:hypothetical protein
METIMETSPEVEVALKNRSVDTAGHWFYFLRPFYSILLYHNIFKVDFDPPPFSLHRWFLPMSTLGI